MPVLGQLSAAEAGALQVRADRRRASQQAPQQAGAEVLDHQHDHALVEAEGALNIRELERERQAAPAEVIP